MDKDTTLITLRFDLFRSESRLVLVAEDNFLHLVTLEILAVGWNRSQIVLLRIEPIWLQFVVGHFTFISDFVEEFERLSPLSEHMIRWHSEE
jgi:hypothetical protein